jgi:hypothetical protein
MADEESETRDNGLDPWSHHGPEADRPALFFACILLGIRDAERLKLDASLRELATLSLEALTSGVNDAHLQRALSISNLIALAVDGYDKVAHRRGRPRNPIRSKPAKQPSATDRRILDEIKTAESKGTSFRAARRAAIDAAVKREGLKLHADRRTDRARIDRWREIELRREREVEQLKQRLVDGLRAGPSCPTRWSLRASAASLTRG